MTDISPLTKGDKTRATLIKVAHDLFLQQGFHGTSMRQIADEAGLALGGLYNYFDSKEKLFAEVLDTYHPYNVIIPTLDQTQGETIEEFVGNAAQLISRSIEGLEEDLLPIVFIDLVEFRGKYIKKLVTKLMPYLLTFFTRFNTRKGKLRKLAPPLMLRTFMAIIIGYLFSEMLLKDMPAIKTAKINWFDGMIDIYLHGIVQE